MIRLFINLLLSAGILASILFFPALKAQAHGGGLNADGCHNDRQTGDYHCHRESGTAAARKGSRSAAPGGTEESYSSEWCHAVGGKEPRLADGTLPDCIAGDYAVEFDWGKGHKPYECVGQALHYARLSGKQPLCILIRKPGQSMDEFARYGRRADSGAVAVRCMSPDRQLEPCPWQP